MENSFQTWVDGYGPEKLCRELRITHYTLKNWCLRRGWPKVLFILEIIRLSHGEMTFEKIIESTRPRNVGIRRTTSSVKAARKNKMVRKTSKG